MKTHDFRLRRFALIAALALLGACTVGPNYVRPTADAPAAFKEMEGWKTAQPRDQELRGKWWETYNDPLLNELEERVSISNQNLAQTAAQFRQARALVQAARAGYLPTVSANASATAPNCAARSASRSWAA